MDYEHLEFIVLGAILSGTLVLSSILCVRKVTEFQSNVLRSRYEEEEEQRTLLRA